MKTFPLTELSGALRRDYCLLSFTMLCQIVLQAGPRRGAVCDRTATQGDVCAYHARVATQRADRARLAKLWDSFDPYDSGDEFDSEEGGSAPTPVRHVQPARLPPAGTWDPYDSGDEFDSDTDSEPIEPVPVPVPPVRPEIARRTAFLQGVLMDKLTTMVYPDTPKECTICLSPGEDMFCAVRTRACHHDFCIGCLRAWVASHKLTCPTCRTDIRISTFLDQRKKK